MSTTEEKPTWFGIQYCDLAEQVAFYLHVIARPVRLTDSTLNKPKIVRVIAAENKAESYAELHMWDKE